MIDKIRDEKCRLEFEEFDKDEGNLISGLKRTTTLKHVTCNESS